MTSPSSPMPLRRLFLALVLALPPPPRDGGLGRRGPPRRRCRSPAGKTIEGVVESADAKEVVLKVGPEERRAHPVGAARPARRLPRPRGAHAGRRRRGSALAWPSSRADLGLFAEARAEYEKALALGALKAKDVHRARGARPRRRAVEQGVGRGRAALADAGDVAGALEIARGLKLAFGEAPNAPAIRALIEDLLAQVRAQDDSAKKDAEELAKAEAQARRAKEILERRMRAEGAINTGDVAAKECADGREQGAVTQRAQGRRGRALDGLHRGAQEPRPPAPHPPHGRREGARRGGRAARTTSTRSSSRCAWRWRSSSRRPARATTATAEEWAAQAAYIDPVDPDLLELRERIADRASGTVAHPLRRRHVTARARPPRIRSVNRDAGHVAVQRRGPRPRVASGRPRGASARRGRRCPCPTTAGHGVVAAQQQRRHPDLHLVGEARAQERAVERGAALHEQPLHAAGSRAAPQSAARSTAAVPLPHRDDLDAAARTERRLARDVARRAGGHEHGRARARRRAAATRPRPVRRRVTSTRSGWRRPSGGPPGRRHVSRGSSASQRPAADEHRVAAPAQLVHLGLGARCP